jgi:hypothetical protein
VEADVIRELAECRCLAAVKVIEVSCRQPHAVEPRSAEIALERADA